MPVLRYTSFVLSILWTEVGMNLFGRVWRRGHNTGRNNFWGTERVWVPRIEIAGGGGGKRGKGVILKEMRKKHIDQTNEERKGGGDYTSYRCFQQIIIVIKEKGETQCKITQITVRLQGLCSHIGWEKCRVNGISCNLSLYIYRPSLSSVCMALVQFRWSRLNDTFSKICWFSGMNMLLWRTLRENIWILIFNFELYEIAMF